MTRSKPAVDQARSAALIRDVIEDVMLRRERGEVIYGMLSACTGASGAARRSSPATVPRHIWLGILHGSVRVSAVERLAVLGSI